MTTPQTSEYEKFQAFGWNVFRKTWNNDESFYVNIPVNMMRSEANNITFITKGKIKEPRIDGNIILHPAGTLSTEVDAKLHIGSHIYTSIGDSEWWCINYETNRLKSAVVKSFVVKAGESKQLPTETLLYGCAGDITISGNDFTKLGTVPGEIFYDHEVTINAQTDFYGLIFESRKA